MQEEALFSLHNVVRFPAERLARPSLSLLREVKPDFDAVYERAAAFALEFPWREARGDADVEMAEYILNNVAPEPGSLRREALDDLLGEVISRAVTASYQWRRAEERLHGLEASGSGLKWNEQWAVELAGEANEAGEVVVRLMIAAYTASEVAEGAGRAIGLAAAGEKWEPRDLHKEADELFFGVVPPPVSYSAKG
jgi:hypothetical protein